MMLDTTLMSGTREWASNSLVMNGARLPVIDWLKPLMKYNSHILLALANGNENLPWRRSTHKM